MPEAGCCTLLLYLHVFEFFQSCGLQTLNGRDWVIQLRAYMVVFFSAGMCEALNCGM